LGAAAGRIPFGYDGIERKGQSDLGLTLGLTRFFFLPARQRQEGRVLVLGTPF
jgi:hypothetical protein